MRAELVALPQHIPDAPALGGVANDSSSGHRRALLAWAPGQVLGWPARDFTPVSVAYQRHRNSRASRRHRLRWRVRVESINRPFATAGGPCTTGPTITTDASGTLAHSRAA
jgi:hypothetical protein